MNKTKWNEKLKVKNNGKLKKNASVLCVKKNEKLNIEVNNDE